MTLGMVGVTFAADNAPHTSLKKWGRFYLGVNSGFTVHDIQLTSQQLGFTHPSGKCNTRTDFSSFFPGLQLGFMRPLPNQFILGMEANVTFNTNQKTNLDCNCPYNPYVSDRFSLRVPMQSSLKGRIGHIIIGHTRTILPYLTAGASFNQTKLSYSNEGGDYYAQNKTQAGALIGAGIEWSFQKNWSFRAEYTYADYGTAHNLRIPQVYGLMDPNGNARVDLNTNNFAFSVNYWL